MRTVFVTGATGCVGGAVVAQLLAQPDTAVRVLIRTRGGDDPLQRLASLKQDPRIQAVLRADEQLTAVAGDITLPLFGLDEAGFNRLARESTHIVHSAASVKLNMTLAQAQDTALKPTRTILDLARRAAEAGALRKLELVSTVGVWGQAPGELPERPVPEVQRYHNTYEAAKADAERAVWATAADLPLTVHRPSMVVGDSVTGASTSFQIFYHLCEFLSGLRTGGWMPALGASRLDTVPVDWVAKVITWSCLGGQAPERVLHLCSGAAGSLSLVDLQTQVRAAWRAHGRKLPGLKTVPRAWFAAGAPLLGRLAGERTRKALAALPAVLSYLAQQQSFANTHTLARLQAAGLPLPPAQAYLGPVLGYYLAHRKP